MYYEMFVLPTENYYFKRIDVIVRSTLQILQKASKNKSNEAGCRLTSFRWIQKICVFLQIASLYHIDGLQNDMKSLLRFNKNI